MPDKRRVYVAIPCPDALREAAVACQEALKGVDDVLILDPATLHLTVIPPWDEPNPDAVVRDLSAVSCAPFELRVTKAGYGSDEADPDLAWLLGEASDGLRRLHLQAWRAIMSHDPPREPFPHVTIARFAKGAALPALTAVEAAGVVDRIALYESLPGRTYRILGERRLT